MKRLFVLLAIVSIVFALAACEAPAPDSGLVETFETRDQAECVNKYHRNASEDTTALHQIMLKYRYTVYTIDVSHELEESTEVGAMFDVMATQKCYNYGVDTWSIVLASE